MGIGTKLVGSLFFLFFLAMGAVFVWLVGREALPGLQTWTWPAMDAEIIRSNVRETHQHGRDTGDFYLDLQYRYSFRGQAYTSTRHTLKSASFSDYSEAARLVQRYSSGSHAVCYVNPNSPAIAVLKRSNPVLGLLMLLPLIFVAIGAIGIYSVWRPGRTPAPDTRALSDLATSTKPQKAGLVVMAIFIGLAAFLGYMFLARPLTRVLSARQWPAVPCTIISSQVKQHSGNKGSTYSVDIFYRYVIDDREYKANRYDFMRVSSSGFAGKQAIVARYPPGSQRLCFVNPRDPTDAVLERGFTPIMWIGLLPLLFVFLGLLGLTSTIRKLRPPLGSMAGSDALFRSGPMGSQAIPAMDSTMDESPRILKPRQSPMMKFLAVLGISCFWNGIVSVFVLQIMRGWHSGPFEWFLSAFMSIFVLIGLGLIVAVLYCFLGLFNPRPRLVINPGVARLGQSIRIDWQIAGRVQALQSLTVRLEGREEATYTRGTNTCTDRNVFADLEIGTATTFQEMAAGDRTITIPAALMHSFIGKHNKIVWSIRLRGEIPRWPDLCEEFPITVLPAQQTQKANM